jgi:uncharacterized protein YkwD
MHHKSILLLVIFLGFLAMGTIFVGNDTAAYAIQSPDAWKVYLPFVMKMTTPPSTPTPTSTPVPSGCILTHNFAYEEQLYELINNKRAEYGLKLLTINYPLETSSGIHSDDMAINHFMSHTGSDGSTFWQRAVKAGYTGHWGGEIIMGGSSPQAAVDWWMNDAPHRAMILGDLDDFGAGFSHCSSNYFTVDFGHR